MAFLVSEANVLLRSLVMAPSQATGGGGSHLIWPKLIIWWAPPSVTRGQPGSPAEPEAVPGGQKNGREVTTTLFTLISKIGFVEGDSSVEQPRSTFKLESPAHQAVKD